MLSSEQAKARIGQLAKRARAILDNPTAINARNLDRLSEAEAFLIAVNSILEKIFDDHSAYLATVAEMKMGDNEYADPYNRQRISKIMHILSDVLDEMNQGLLSTFASAVQATIFDDFIDHAQFFLDAGRKNEAGAIAGVTLEDSIRKLCDKNSIPEQSRKLDELISDLLKVKVLNSLESKRARVGAHVRTKATHAQWDEFDAAGVRETIDIVRNILLPRLAT